MESTVIELYTKDWCFVVVVLIVIYLIMTSNKENSDSRKCRCNVRNCARSPLASIHRLPIKNDFVRKQWIRKLKLCDLKDPFYVCGDHFKDEDFNQGGKTRKRLCEFAVPSVNLPSNSEDNPMESTADDESDLSFHEEQLLESSIGDEIFIPIDWSSTSLDIISEEENECFVRNQAEAFRYYDKTTPTHNDTCDRCIQANLAYDEAMKPWTLLDGLRNDSDLQTWTGLPNFLTLNNIVKFVKGLGSAQDEMKKFKATPELLVVFVMTKLKTKLTFKHLATLFSLTPTTLDRYFDNFIPILKTVLKPVIFWPAKEQVYNNLPKSFKPDFDDCLLVMDCSEAPIQRLQSLDSRIKTHSDYKGCYTAKINICSAPSGLVVNVSRAWGGKASDKYIVIKERILEKFSENEGAMVDKGYDIAKEASNKGIKEEAIYNTNVATSRIHVERIIQRIKIFDVFNSKINKSMLKHIDDIVFIACAICNLSAPVLADDKF